VTAQDQAPPSDGDAFMDLVDRAVASIPSPFAAQLASVAIVVEDEPSQDQLASVGSRGLYGLYQGVPRTAYGAGNAAFASKITIFRGPLERRYRDRAALGRAVEDTVVHEVAHHLGIDDARIRELQRSARR
jgi:predicted Zn-dependent protease with MMP-like domain